MWNADASSGAGRASLSKAGCPRLLQESVAVTAGGRALLFVARIPLTLDEHFCALVFECHRYCSGFDLSEPVLRKLDLTSASKVMKHRRERAPQDPLTRRLLRLLQVRWTSGPPPRPQAPCRRRPPAGVRPDRC